MLQLDRLLMGGQWGLKQLAIDLAPTAGVVNDFDPQAGAFIRHTGATAAFDFTGIKAPDAGDEYALLVYFASGYDVTIKHDDSRSLAANRIYCFQSMCAYTPSDAVVGCKGIAQFIYDKVDQKWLLVTYIGT